MRRKQRTTPTLTSDERRDLDETRRLLWIWFARLDSSLPIDPDLVGTAVHALISHSVLLTDAVVAARWLRYDVGMMEVAGMINSITEKLEAA